MQSRGLLIGEIIDELAVLGAQVKMRNAVNLLDLNIVAEDFFKEFLNILLGVNLINLNEGRSNEPGMDLGDESRKLAVQVTSKADTAKVNGTLNKITKEQERKYDRFVILGLNRRQSTYAINKVKAVQHNFKSSRDIWDLDSLAKKAMSLNLDRLQDLHRFMRKSAAKLRVELEVPDNNGIYPTSAYKLWENAPAPKIGNGSEFSNYLRKQDSEASSDVEIKKALKALAKKLSRLPRVSREFLALLFENRELGESQRLSEHYSHLLLSKVKRQYLGTDLLGELEILSHAGFLKINEDDIGDRSGPEIGLIIPSNSDDLVHNFVPFVEERKLGFRSVIASINLSGF